MNARLSVARGEGRVDFEVEAPARATVLDALELATGMNDILYRHSCHHGSCGVCGALVNGEPRLLCRTRLSELPPGVVRLDPLPYATVIADLAVEPGPLFDSLPDSGYLRPPARAGLPTVPDPAPLPGDPAERARERFEDCIECGLCLAACPVLVPRAAERSSAGAPGPSGTEPIRPFVGPAALGMARREIVKGGPLSREARAVAAAPDGVAACDRTFACSRACPRGVAPGRLIEELRQGA